MIAKRRKETVQFTKLILVFNNNSLVSLQAKYYEIFQIQLRNMFVTFGMLFLRFKNIATASNLFSKSLNIIYYSYFTVT